MTMPHLYKFFTALTVMLSFIVLAQTDLTFRTIALPEVDERVTGVYCTSATACVVSTEGGVDSYSHLYATDGQSITATLFTGDYDFGETLGTTGTIGFLGFSKVGDTLIAHVDGAADALLSATGDVTNVEAWTVSTLGIPDGSTSFGANQQIGFGMKDNRWVYFRRATLYESSDTPGAGALWLPLWAPSSPGEIPSNFLELYRADPKLCAADPNISISPKLTQLGYVASDLSLILYGAGSRNQNASVTPGVCISTDGGKLFYHVPFEGVEGDLGPLGVSCFSDNHCAAYGGLEYEPDSAYIYVTTDAQKGVDSSWQRATLPNLKEDTRFRGVAFSPDGMTGFAVGASGSSSPLVFTTNDGGATWTDATSSVRALAPDSRLHTVYVFDNEHVWIGGEKGTLLTSGE
jgi:hypothetical protein